MAEESSGQEKTEDPTSRRLAESRKKGDVAKSMEIPSAAVLLAGLLTIYALSNHILTTLQTLTSHFLANSHTLVIIPANMTQITLQCLNYTGQVLGPIMAVVFITALLANYSQIGFLFTTEKIKPELSKIDPLKGIARKFSLQTLNELLKSLFKIAIIGFIAYREVVNALPQFMPLMDQQPFQILSFMASTAFWIFLKCAIVIAVLAALDYAFQRWQFMKKMKMTKQEVKEEAKQTEGDPHVKGRIRSIQMEMARKRMMDEVPSADVVVTNPTRLAIALRYDSDTMSAPIVAAKGAGLVAQRIREIAKENKIPIVEDKPLARALFQAAAVDQPIPDNLYQAVAEVLAYVYSTKKNRAA